MPTFPSFSDTQLQAICDILGDTSEGLIGSEIARLLTQCGIDDPSAGATKRYRLFTALNLRQKQDRCANNQVWSPTQDRSLAWHQVVVIRE
jgi:hypothetical protein